MLTSFAVSQFRCTYTPVAKLALGVSKDCKDRMAFKGYRKVSEFAQLESNAINYVVCFLGDLRSKTALGVALSVRFGDSNAGACRVDLPCEEYL